MDISSFGAFWGAEGKGPYPNRLTIVSALREYLPLLRYGRPPRNTARSWGGTRLTIAKDARWIELNTPDDAFHTVGRFERGTDLFKEFIPEGVLSIDIGSLKFDSGQQLLDMVAEDSDHITTTRGSSSTPGVGPFSLTYLPYLPVKLVRAADRGRCCLSIRNPQLF
jgi:hypothetical protein